MNDDIPECDKDDRLTLDRCPVHIPACNNDITVSPAYAIEADGTQGEYGLGFRAYDKETHELTLEMFLTIDDAVRLSMTLDRVIQLTDNLPPMIEPTPEAKA